MDETKSVYLTFHAPCWLATAIQAWLYESLPGELVPFLSYHQPDAYVSPNWG